MIIRTDAEGKDVIEQLCDIALKQGGIQNLNQINKVLHAVELLPDKKKDKKKNDKVKK